MRLPCNRPSNQHSFVVDGEEEVRVVHKQPTLNRNHRGDLVQFCAVGVSVVLFDEVEEAGDVVCSCHPQAILSSSYMARGSM